MSVSCFVVKFMQSVFTPCLKKTVKIVFCHNFVKFSPTLIIFGTKMAKTIRLCKMHFLLYPVYVNALPCKTQMLQIVTLHCGYLYRVAYLCIINSTEGATFFYEFCGIKYFVAKMADNKIANKIAN